jgi:two-component system, OmpR family, phosphate regulon sensor histidine kinase PhoR
LRISIHYKITFVFLVISALTFFGAYLHLNKTLRDRTFDRIQSNLVQKTSLAKTYLESADIDMSDTKDFRTFVTTVSNDLSLRVTIIGNDGVVRGDSEVSSEDLPKLENHLHRPEVQQALRADFGESTRFSSTLKKNMLYVAEKYKYHDTFAFIRLAIDLSEVDAISDNLRRMLVISFAVAFIIAVLFGFIASMIISKPIKEISTAAVSMTKGEFSRVRKISSNDEIGDLAKAFNYMSDQIESRIKEVTINKSHLEAVLLSMYEGVMVVNKYGVITLSNDSLKKCLKIEENLIGKKPLEVIKNFEIGNMVSEALSLSNGNTIKREITFRIPNEKTILVYATPLIRNDKNDGVVLVFHNISQIRQLEKIRRDFVANASHELRTPITSIRGYAETLLDGALEDKNSAVEFLKIIHFDAERLSKLIEDLLSLSKIESDKLNLDIKPNSITEMFAPVLMAFSKAVKDKGLNIKTDIPENLPKVLCDRLAIVQVFSNLIDNAIKYTEKGHIEVSAKETEKEISIDVKDTGIGIPQKDIPRLFERFYRVDKARSRELGGTGLGLSIVKHIIQSHKGNVEVKSSLDKGSTFTFTLPKA